MAGSASALSLFNSLSSLCCNRAFENLRPSSSSEKRFSFTCFASKKKKLGFMNQILDYIEGGPKLRKWYGAPDILEKDGNELNEDEAPEEDEVRDAVLVTDGDNEIGQVMLHMIRISGRHCIYHSASTVVKGLMVLCDLEEFRIRNMKNGFVLPWFEASVLLLQMIILQLIVKRLRVKALVKDKRVAMEAFGAYVESMSGDTKEETFLKKAFRGVRAVICPVEGSLYSIDGWKGIQHVILLSQGFERHSSSHEQQCKKTSRAR